MSDDIATMAVALAHVGHVERGEWHDDCNDCHTDAVALDWIVCVRVYGLEVANRMFPG